MNILDVVLGVIAAVTLYVIVIYNGLVRLRVRVNGAWSDIEVQMKRRYNLIPNLIETVKGYANHEAGTLENSPRRGSRHCPMKDLLGNKRNRKTCWLALSNQCSRSPRIIRT